MPAASQRGFELELPQAAAAGNYQFLRMHGGEALGRLFEYRIHFCSDRPSLDALKLIGEKVTLSMATAFGKRHFNGYAAAFESLGPIELPLSANAKQVAQFEYAVIARPWLWWLTRSTDCRVFQQKKVVEIVEAIFADYPGLTDKDLRGEYKPWEFCVQYRETDFNFVSRMLEQEGIFYFFKHDATEHRLQLVDLHGPTTDTKHTLPYVTGEARGRTERETVRDWQVAYEPQPGTYVLKDYDFKKPTAPQLSKVKKPREHTHGDLEFFDYPGGFDTPDEGDVYVRHRIDELQAQHEVFRAHCNAREFAAGDVFELSNAEQAGASAGVKYLVTQANFVLSAGLEHEAAGPSFHCGFSCIRAKTQFRPQRSTPKPFVQGPQTATVVGPDGEDIHTDEYGRIKVRFHWDRHSNDDKESSCWIRVSQPWAGKNFGMIAIPRMGQEVVVDFLEGDPDRPLVTGRVYNQHNMPPFGLPANKTQTGLVTRSSKEGSAANANILRFEDKKGEEQVYLHAEKNQDIEVENDETHRVGHDRKKMIDNDETTHVKHDRTEVVDNNERISIGIDRTETVGGNETLSVGMNRREQIGVDHIESIGSNMSIMIGSTLTETVGINYAETVGGAMELTVGGMMLMSVGGGLAETVGVQKVESIGGSKSETIGANRSIEVGGSSSESVGKDKRLEVRNDMSEAVGGKRDVSVTKEYALKAKKIQLVADDEIAFKTGSAEVILKKNGDIMIKGGKVNIKASSDVQIKGSTVKEN